MESQSQNNSIENINSSKEISQENHNTQKKRKKEEVQERAEKIVTSIEIPLKLMNIRPFKYFLAPLVGGSDLSFRLLCRKYGAQVTYTEMCVAQYWLSNSLSEKKVVFEFDPSDRPLVLQLAGNDAKPIIQLANHKMFENKVDYLDINCGCPQSFALEKGYGSALLRDAKHLVAMCKEIVENVKYPVSVKLRLHESVDTTIDIMKQLYSVGVKTFTVHGRYYWQKGDKRGLADWNALKRIRESFPNIQIIGNGNIGQYLDFEKMIKETNVDSAMAGYGALCNPAIFSSIKIPLAQQIEDYLTIARSHQNKWIDILRHLHWMLKSHNCCSEDIEKLFQCKHLSQVISFLNSLSSPLSINLPPLNPNEQDKIEYPEERISKKKAKRQKVD